MARGLNAARVDRSQLPDEFTPDTVRAMGMRTARRLARPDNGVLTPDEQVAFDRALRTVLQGSADRLGRARRGPPPADADLRRSYQRTRRRLDDQATRARRAFPQLTEGWNVDDAPAPAEEGEDEATAAAAGGADDISIGTFETEIEQTSDTLELLEQIATLQQQQLEHQRSQLLSSTRGVFFAAAVSVAVIVAGVAPLVESSADDRLLILVWTAAICLVAGLVYAGVRAFQSRST